MHEGADVLAALTALALWLFAADYCRVRWWTNPGGRLVFSVIVTFALVMSLVAARVWFGDFVLHEWARALIYLVALCVVLSCWTWFHRSQRRGRARSTTGGRHRP